MDPPPPLLWGGTPFSIPLVQLLNNAINHLGINVWDLQIINMPQHCALAPINLCICHTLIVRIELESPSLEEPSKIFRKKPKAACSVPYRDLVSFAYIAGLPFSSVMYFSYSLASTLVISLARGNVILIWIKLYTSDCRKDPGISQIATSPLSLEHMTQDSNNNFF